jgi:hypothetical protein
MKVVYKKLGRQRAYGLVYSDEEDILYIDPRVKGKKLLEVLIHEASHQLLPQAEEEEIIRISVALTKLLWKQKFRRVDDANNLPMQDGTK